MSGPLFAPFRTCTHVTTTSWRHAISYWVNIAYVRYHMHIMLKRGIVILSSSIWEVFKLTQIHTNIHTCRVTAQYIILAVLGIEPGTSWVSAFVSVILIELKGSTADIVMDCVVSDKLHSALEGLTTHGWDPIGCNRLVAFRFLASGDDIFKHARSLRYPPEYVKYL
jgi:hypothetical protein